MFKHTLLLVDDDVILLEFMKEFLEKRNFVVETCSTGADGIERVKANPSKYSVVIVDYLMSQQDGAETTKAILEIDPSLIVLIYSGDPERDAVLLTSRNGATSFVDKKEGLDFFYKEVLRLCEKYEKERVTITRTRTPSDNEEIISSIGMVGCSSLMAEVVVKVNKLQSKSGPVLILGESGSGKELVARALHPKGEKRFRAVNCADYLMSKETARSELFGHMKGSFTGADADRMGIFEEVGDGTIFLDEIYCLPPEAQTGLLRALQERVIKRLGGHKEIPIRARVISAGKPDIEKDIAQEKFKPDLYHRISQNVIQVPALRDRKEDIAPLIEHFCKRWSEENREKKEFLASTVPVLERYSWPGNIRELENVVYSVLNTSEKNLIGPEDLGQKFTSLGSKPSSSAGSIHKLRAYIEEVEKEYLIEVLKSCHGSLKDAASVMQITSPGVIHLLKKHKLNVKDIVSESSPKSKGRRKK